MLVVYEELSALWYKELVKGRLSTPSKCKVEPNIDLSLRGAFLVTLGSGASPNFEGEDREGTKTSKSQKLHQDLHVSVL